jgi:FHA domain
VARLVVNPDSPEAWEIELSPGTHSLGRAEENEIRLEHPSVSSSHCQIVVSGAGAFLKDLGSTTGTFVDGQLVEDARLRAGQVFCLGEVRLRFEADAPPEPDSPAASPPPARTVVRVQPGSPTQEPLFVSRLVGAFLYPLKKDGVLLLVTGTIAFSILDAGKFFARFAAVKGMGIGTVISLAFLLLMTALGVGYLTSYLRRVVISTAMGDTAAPDWPDLTDFVADILSPLFQLVAAVLASLVPALLVALLVPRAEMSRAAQVAIGFACGLGGLYFPMAFLAVAMFDSAAAVNPLLVVPSIVKVPGPYLLSVALFGGVLTALWACDNYLPKAIGVPIVPAVVSNLAGLYLLMVQARVMGLLYLTNRDRLSWFGRQRAE